MSNYFHPGVTRYMAEQLIESVTDRTKDILEINASNIAVAERALNRHACSAAGIMGNDPSSIYRSVWYRSDGWGHGGSAISWRDRAEELEAELAVKNSLIDRAKSHLECYSTIMSTRCADSLRTSVEVQKLLTDIEHL